MARTRPHIKVHISVADHPKTSEVWADLAMRGMLVELWRKAGEKFAGKTDDRVPLKPTDRMDIAGTTDQARADQGVTELCARVGYELRRYPNRWVVKVRKFAKKQGFQSEELETKPDGIGQELPPPNPNPNPNPNPKKRESAPPAPPATPAPRTPRRSPEVPFPGAMTDQDWLDLGANHGVDPDRLRDLVAKWAGEKDRRYAAKGWRMAVDRALRDRWAWTSSLFATPNGMIQNNRESAAQARVRRTDEAGDKALALLLGGQAPLLTAIEGGSR